MRYKTLFRVLLKFLGVWLIIDGLALTVGTAIQVVEVFSMGRGGFSYDTGFIAWGISGLIQLVAGLYLFFGGRWIVDKAIPGNRPYCHECGYDLSKTTSANCTECGTPTSRTRSEI